MRVEILEVLAVAGLKLNHNQRRQILEFIEDIANRDNLSHTEILSKPQLETILENNNLSGPDKIKKLTNKLIEMRYPAYSKAKAALEAEIKKLKLHPKIKVVPTPYFEDNKIRVELNYNDTDELGDIIESLKKLSKADVIKNALEA